MSQAQSGGNVYVEHLGHEVFPPQTEQVELDRILAEEVQKAHARGERGKTLFLLKTEPVYNAETGEMVNGTSHAHHAQVHINDDGTYSTQQIGE